jgi:bifunctional non-homologous end joining protein LigD
VPTPKVKASFIEPMLLLRTEKLSEGKDWMYEIKYDGFRALAIKTVGRVCLRSRNNNDFTSRFPNVAKGTRPDPE